MFVAAGVPIDHLRIAAVIHGAATPIVLRDQAYRTKTGHANPNVKLLDALRSAGVNIYLCGQSASANGMEAADTLPAVTLTLSATTDFIVLQNGGYKLVPQ